MRKKITIKNIYDLFNINKNVPIKVNTPYGYKKILACDITAKNSKYVKTNFTNGSHLVTSYEHLLKKAEFGFVKIRDLNIGDKVETKEGKTKIKSFEHFQDRKDLYDIQVEEVEQYYANSIVSHNSSIVDSLLWSKYNSISKNVRKNVDIINQNRDFASTSVDIQIDNKLYTVDRQATKYIKKLYGEETVEAKTAVDFSVVDLITEEKTSLNGLDRKETDANIRKIFGNIDDFLLTSMTSQNGSMQFINEGSTKRKEILSKFLDLEIFDKKFKLAKEDSAELKAAIKKLEGRDFDNEILDSHKSVLLTEKQIEENSKLCSLAREELRLLNEELSSIKVKINSSPDVQYIDISKTNNDLLSYCENKKACKAREESLEKEIREHSELLSKLEITLQEYDWDKLQNDKQKLETLNKQSILLNSQVRSLETDILNKQQKIKILDEVPCGDKYPACKYLVDANTQKTKLPLVKEELAKQRELETNVASEIETLGDSLSKINECNKLKQNKIKLESIITNAKLKKEKNKNELYLIDLEISKLEADREKYYVNEEWMKELHALSNKEKELKIKSVSLNKVLTECDQKTSGFYLEKGVLLQKIANLEEQKEQLKNTREEYSCYELFLKSMHSNGIVYDIIKKKLPLINQEMSKILSNIVNFDIFFEDDGKKLDIYIKHPKYDARPLELCSGAEKSIASIAIRLAFIKTSNLPVGDIMILDEPATSLDEENMEGFVRILEMVKNEFKTVIIISHLDALKDVVDEQVSIEKIDGFASVKI